MFHHKPGTVVAVLTHEDKPGYKAEVIEYRKNVNAQGTFERYIVSIQTAGMMGEETTVPASSVIPWPKHGLFKGTRVGTHPATDEWIQGDRYGTVIKTFHLAASIKLDSGRIRHFTYYNLINPDTKKPYEEV